MARQYKNSRTLEERLKNAQFLEKRVSFDRGLFVHTASCDCVVSRSIDGKPTRIAYFLEPITIGMEYCPNCSCALVWNTKLKKEAATKLEIYHSIDMPAE